MCWMCAFYDCALVRVGSSSTVSSLMSSVFEIWLPIHKKNTETNTEKKDLF